VHGSGTKKSTAGKVDLFIFSKAYNGQPDVGYEYTGTKLFLEMGLFNLLTKKIINV
jgi:hypothetical protein